MEIVHTEGREMTVKIFRLRLGRLYGAGLILCETWPCNISGVTSSDLLC